MGEAWTQDSNRPAINSWTPWQPQASHLTSLTIEVRVPVPGVLRSHREHTVQYWHTADAELTASFLSFSCVSFLLCLFLSVLMSSLLSPYYSFSFSLFTLILLSLCKLSFLSLGIALPKVNI